MDREWNAVEWVRKWMRRGGLELGLGYVLMLYSLSMLSCLASRLQLDNSF